MPARKSLIHGVGVNDWHESTAEGSEARPFYNKWRDMLDRCYSGSHAAYEGVTVCEEWHLFSNFKRWMDSQPWKGKELDKDILFKGNRVYSPSTCVFVPRIINLQFRKTRNSSKQNELPAGVYLYPYDGKVVKYKVNGIGEHLGYVRDPMEGHKIWQRNKIERLKGLLGISGDSRVDDRIVSVIEEIKTDLENGLETDWK